MVRNTLIKNVNIIDCIKDKTYKGNISINDGKICEVGNKNINSKHTNILDFEGLFVCPGFIDMHSHSDLQILQSDVISQKCKQGITTEIVGLDGFSLVPMYSKSEWGHGPKEWKDRISFFTGDSDIDILLKTFSSYIDYLKSSDLMTNVAAFVGHGTIRYNVLGMRRRSPNESELEEMADLVSFALQDGAIGLSTSFSYSPQKYGSSEELKSITSRLQSNSGVLNIHLGLRTRSKEEKAHELAKYCRKKNIRIHFSQLETFPYREEHIEFMLDLIDSYDQNVSADIAPFKNKIDLISRLLPPHLFLMEDDNARIKKLHKSPEKVIEKLNEEKTRDIIEDYIVSGSKEWENIPKNIGWENINILDYEDGEYYRKNLLNFDASKDPVDIICDLITERGFGVLIEIKYGGDGDLKSAICNEKVAVGSGSEFGYTNDERKTKSFQKYLQDHHSRCNTGLINSIKSITSLPSEILGLENKGYIQQGMDADLVFMNTDNTNNNFNKYNTNIKHVMANGEFIISNSKPTGNFPGKVLP